MIDDEPPLRRLLQDFFEHQGWQVATAADGLEGFRSASRGNFDLVTMDIRMPGVNGVDSLRSMSLAGQGAKVVVISGFVTQEIAAECREAGAAAVLAKPVELSALGRLADELVPTDGETAGE